MPEEKKPNPALTFLIKHGEKVGLGIACALLLAYVLLGIVQNEEGKIVQDLRSKIAHVEQEIKLEHEPLKPQPLKPYVVDTFANWNKVSSASPADDYSGTLLPALVKNPEKEKAVNTTIRTKELLLPGFALNPAKASIEGVSLSWTLDEIEEGDADKYDVKNITSFSVERELAGSGKWEVLEKELPAETLSYKDTKIQPRTEYNYRVTSYCKDAAYTAKHPDSKGEMETTADPVKTVSLWSIKFIQTMKNMARIEIEKFDLEIGDRVTIAHNHYAGEKIGWWPETKDGKPTSKHRISLRGRSIVVDFDTGMKLISVTPGVSFKGEFKRCKEKFDAGGRYIECDLLTQSLTVKLDKIVFTDEDGKEQAIFRPDPKTHRLLKDQICSRCRTPEIPDADQPETDSPDKAAEAPREKEAKKMFETAMKQATVPTLKAPAVNKLQALLKDYKNTSFVKENQEAIKAKLEELTGQNPK